MSRKEFEIWQTRATLIPFGWVAKEREISRIETVTARSNGSSATQSDYFNDYVDPQAYDEENYEFAKEFIKTNKG